MDFQKDTTFIAGRLKSVGYAWHGAKRLITTEHSIIIQGVIAGIFIVAGFCFGLTSAEWMFQTLAMGLVLGVEGLNTAIEKLADVVEPKYDERIGIIKDIGAGAVLFAAIAALAIGAIIYLPKLA